MKYPDQVNPQRQKVDRWLPMVGGGGQGGRKETGEWSYFLSDEHFLKLIVGDSYVIS